MQTSHKLSLTTLSGDLSRKEILPVEEQSEEETPWLSFLEPRGLCNNE